MFRLKDLLSEESGEEEWYGNKSHAKKFLRYVKSGDWIVPQKDGIDLYRGTDRHTMVGVKEKYKGDRDPTSTDKDIQDIVDAIATGAYSVWPRRGMSRFCTTKTGVARSYGVVHYTFPRKDSKVVSYGRDTYIKYLGGAENPDYVKNKFYDLKWDMGSKDEVYEFLREHFDTKVIGAIQAYYEASKGNLRTLRAYSMSNSLEDQLEYLGNGRDFVFNSSQSALGLRGEKKTYQSLYELFSECYYLAKDIKEYFDGGERGIKNGAEEVIVEGDVLHAKKDFVDKYLEFEEGEWRLIDD